VRYGGRALTDGRPLAAYGITRGSTLELVPIEPSGGGELPSGSPLLSSPTHGLYEDWRRACAGLATGNTPKLAPAGTGGSYFIQDVSGRSVAVFKPADEEPGGASNPRGLSVSPSGEGLRKGTRAGEGAVREVAAYLLDHGRFSGVPPTALVTCKVSTSPGADADGGGGTLGAAAPAAPKVGSLQQFVRAEGDLEERGTSGLPPGEVHKIAVLDLRLGNTDRNGANILLRRDADGTPRLTPIDHGYCLPASLEDLSFEWLYWPQAKVPFDRTTLAYIAGLDAEADVQLLAAHGLRLRPECARVLRVCTLLLQRGAAAGLTAHQIGAIACRQAFTKSPLEKLHHRAMQLAAAEGGGGGGGGPRVAAGGPLDLRADGAARDAAYLAHLGALLDAFLPEVKLEHGDGDGDLLL
jgi:hypothetical protein